MQKKPASAEHEENGIMSMGQKVRALRHATSIPLIVIGLGVIVGSLEPMWAADGFIWALLLPPATFAILYAIMRIRADSLGIGMGREGYGWICVVMLPVSVLTPVSIVLGYTFLLGIGLWIIGWRGRDRRLWPMGVALAVLSPLLNFFLLQNLAYAMGLPVGGLFSVPFYGFDNVVLGLAGAATLLTGVRAATLERRTVQP